MGKDELKSLIGLWDAEIHSALSLKEPSWPKLQGLLKETYKALTLYHKDGLVPKELARIMLCMDEFLYFTSLMEEKEKVEVKNLYFLYAFFYFVPNRF